MSREHLDWTDPTVAAAWLTDVSQRCDDVIAVAEDQTASIADRRLGRAEAKRLLAEAKTSLASLLAFARRGLAGSADPRAPKPSSPSPPRKARAR